MIATVTYIDHMGDDNDVVNAARVSFSKSADQYTDTQNERLIKYLRNHQHWSPFSHAFIKFHVTAPIFVARQLFKHQVGIAINEESRRYIDTDPTFDAPTIWRNRPPKSMKQGSGDIVTDETNSVINQIVAKHTKNSMQLYKELLRLNVAPEQARTVLPLYTNTSWIWTGSVEAWLRVCGLRLAPDAQEESRQVAEQVSVHLKELFPKTWSAAFPTTAPLPTH